MTDKDSALQLINKLPDDVTLEDIMYELYFRSQVELGLRQLDEDETTSQDEVKKNLVEWLRSAGR
jgi:hypothetical protein